MDELSGIEEMCSDIENEALVCNGKTSEELMKKTIRLFEYMRPLSKVTKSKVEKALVEIMDKSDFQVKVWLYSALIGISDHPKIIEELLKYSIEEKRFSPNNRYFLLNQIKNILFKRIDMNSDNIRWLRWKFLEQTVLGFKKELDILWKPIPLQERNQDVAIVITQQILCEEHGPTKTALDRCKILIEYMHKKVLLINTAEMTSLVGEIPFYNVQGANYIPEFTEWETIEWKNTKIPYFQCEQNMPNTHILKMLLKLVRDQKPGLVVEIGTGSILASLINDMIPVLTVGTVPSDWEESMTRCQTLGRKLLNSDLELLQEMGKDEDSIIPGVFTSSLQIQRGSVTRKELGLPQNNFIIVIIGVRLDVEIDEPFLHMLANTLDDDMSIAIIGEFKLCESYIQKMPKLKDKVFYLGHSNDILSWIELCDLYVNPQRKGGGTSSVEALYKGLPVITLPYGDVSVNAGKKFFTESYDTMKELILKYKNDSKFYQTMSSYAKQRAALLLDSEKEFQRIIREFESRIEYHQEE